MEQDLSLLQQLVLGERREDARRQGISLGTLLEQQALETALRESQQEHHETAASSSAAAVSSRGGGVAAEVARDGACEHEGEDGPESPVPDATEGVIAADGPSDAELNMWFHLPQVLQDRILIILLDVDILGVLCCVSKSNTFLRPSPLVYKRVCEHIYPGQTKKKALSAEKWKGSYRMMLLHRPRLRLNGFYSLRTTFTKAPCNDAFWEERRVESIESKFFRHFRFFNDGRLLYCLDVVDPQDLPRIFHKQVPKKVFEGTYSLQGRRVQVEVPMHYCTMFFQLQLCDGNEGFDLGYVGKFNLLKIQEHSSLAEARSLGVNPTSFGGQVDGLCKYGLPLDCHVRFYKVRQW